MGQKKMSGPKKIMGLKKKLKGRKKVLGTKNVKSQMVPDSIRTCQIVPESAW